MHGCRDMVLVPPFDRVYERFRLGDCEQPRRTPLSWSCRTLPGTLACRTYGVHGMDGCEIHEFVPHDKVSSAGGEPKDTEAANAMIELFRR